MGIDIGKSLKVATIPIVILIAIGVFSAIIGAIPFVNFLLCLLGLPMWIVSLAVLGWSGYKAVKEAQMDLVGGAVTGGLAGLISSVVNGIVGLVMSMLGIGVGLATGGNDGMGAAVGVGFGVVAVVVGVVIGTITGLVLGAIGAFVAGMKK
ncbi:MAG: hypothetical protein AB1324_01815 [Candidatus Micrarchaeota archaeon]